MELFELIMKLYRWPVPERQSGDLENAEAPERIPIL